MGFEETQLDEWRKELAAIQEKILSNPNADGWLRLIELLEEAKKDRRVMTSPGACDFLELILDLAKDSVTAGTADEALQPLEVLFASSMASINATKRFKEIREAEQWVVSEWKRDKNKDEWAGNKSDFARVYSKVLLEERGIKVTDRTIRERWLKGH